MNPAGDNNQTNGKPDQKIATKPIINFFYDRFLLIRKITYKYAIELNTKNSHFTRSGVILANNPVNITNELNTMISSLVSLSILKIIEISTIKNEQLTA